jgi:hypothetical protein
VNRTATKFEGKIRQCVEGESKTTSGKYRGGINQSDFFP